MTMCTEKPVSLARWNNNSVRQKNNNRSAATGIGNTRLSNYNFFKDIKRNM